MSVDNTRREPGSLKQRSRQYLTHTVPQSVDDYSKKELLKTTLRDDLTGKVLFSYADQMIDVISI